MDLVYVFAMEKRECDICHYSYVDRYILVYEIYISTDKA